MDIMKKDSDKDSKMLTSIRCQCVRMELNVDWACLSEGIKFKHRGYDNYFFSDSDNSAKGKDEGKMWPCMLISTKYYKNHIHTHTHKLYPSSKVRTNNKFKQFLHREEGRIKALLFPLKILKEIRVQ